MYWPVYKNPRHQHTEIRESYGLISVFDFSVKLGSTCESSIATDASDAIQTCKTEIKEDMDDYDYDLEFPPNPPSAAVSSELHSVGSAVTMKAESSDDDTPACGVVVKTEKPDDFFFDESCY